MFACSLWRTSLELNGKARDLCFFDTEYCYFVSCTLETVGVNLVKQLY